MKEKESGRLVRVALVGQPNVGKSSLTNALAKSNIHVANFTGTTVQKLHATRVFRGVTLDFVDLPGTYALSDYSLEEKVTKRYLDEMGEGVVLNVVDSTNLERNLFLSADLLELNKKMIIALNMSDEARIEGVEIDAHQLSQILGVPVIKVSANTGENLDALLELVLATDAAPLKPSKRNYTDILELEIEQFTSFLDAKKFASVTELIAKNRVENGRFVRTRDVAIGLLKGVDALSHALHNKSAWVEIAPELRKHLDSIYAQTHQEALSDTFMEDTLSFAKGAAMEVTKIVLSKSRSESRLETRLESRADSRLDSNADSCADIKAESKADSKTTSKTSKNKRGLESIESTTPSTDSKNNNANRRAGFGVSAQNEIRSQNETRADSKNAPALSPTRRRDAAIDRVLLNKVAGIPIFLFFMWALFQLTFILGAYPQEWIEEGFAALGALAEAIPNPLLSSFVADGVIGGVGAVLSFLPNILILFFGIFLLEGTGYMARVAFLLDGFFHKFGLHGKSFIPLVSGFGCSIPAFMSARVLKNQNDRMLTLFIINFMSCSARLPVYTLFVSAFFSAETAGNALFAIYIFGALVGLIMAKVLKLTAFKGDDEPFVMEMPKYRMPRLKMIAFSVWLKAAMFIKKAGSFILLTSIIVWAASSFPRVEIAQDSSLRTSGEAAQESSLQATSEVAQDSSLRAERVARSAAISLPETKTESVESVIASEVKSSLQAASEASGAAISESATQSIEIATPSLRTARNDGAGLSATESAPDSSLRAERVARSAAISESTTQSIEIATPSLRTARNDGAGSTTTESAPDSSLRASGEATSVAISESAMESAQKSNNEIASSWAAPTPRNDGAGLSATESVQESAQDSINAKDDSDDAALKARALEHSFLGMAGNFISPIFAPMDFDWKLSVAMISGLAAKEVIISTLGVLYALGDVGEDTKSEESLFLQDALRASVSLPSAVAFILFIMFYNPCLAASVVFAKEAGGRKYIVYLFLFTSLVSYAFAYLGYLITSLLT